MGRSVDSLERRWCHCPRRSPHSISCGPDAKLFCGGVPRENQGVVECLASVDDEIRDMAFKFIDKAKADGKPFFVWLNPTRMHIVNSSVTQI